MLTCRGVKIVESARRDCGRTYVHALSSSFDEQSLRLESGLTPSTQSTAKDQNPVFGPYGVHYFENVRRKPYPAITIVSTRWSPSAVDPRTAVNVAFCDVLSTLVTALNVLPRAVLGNIASVPINFTSDTPGSSLRCPICDCP